MVVDDKIAKMEAAAELDAEARSKNQPAINKLKMLHEVEAFLAQVRGEVVGGWRVLVAGGRLLVVGAVVLWSSHSWSAYIYATHHPNT